MSAPAPSGGKGFSLFPSTGRPPSRTQVARSPQTHQNQQQHLYFQDGAPEASGQQFGEAVTADVRQPLSAQETVAAAEPRNPDRSNSVQSRSSIAKVRLSTYDDNPPEMDDPPPPMPGQAADIIEQQQLQHLQQQQQGTRSAQQTSRRPALRSIFPTYNPDVSLDQQQYFPTQTSPNRIPRNAISRPLYSPISPADQQSPQSQSQPMQSLGASRAQTSPVAATGPRQQSVLYQPPVIIDTPVYSEPATIPASLQPLQYQQQQQQHQNWPTSAGAAAAAAAARGGGGRGEAPSRPVPSSTEDLRNFWKVANGWKAGPSEGRVYCLRMSCDKDTPIYRLCSANNQPFYRLRLDPTSMSAKVTLARHDPARPFKLENANANKNGSGAADDSALGSGSGGNSMLDLEAGVSAADSVVGGTAGGSAVAGSSVGPAVTAAPNPYIKFDSSKNWQEAMSTTLEEESRRHQPQDGLVALLYPSAAARMALERSSDMAMVMTAERECARLVWDDDTNQFFLVHPALALPFCVTIERSTTWSRTAYTLEHLESPQHLARLTRDGTGAGYLEIDTGIASKIDAVYLVDVAIAALVLVAHSDKQFTEVEQFEPPPDMRMAFGAGGAGAGAHGLSPRGSLATMVMMGATGRSSRQSMASAGAGEFTGSGRKKGMGFFGRKPPKAAKRAGRSRMADEFDQDLESQTSIDLSGKMFEMGPMGMATSGNDGTNASKKKRKNKDSEKDKVPGCLRLLTMMFKCCFWCVSICVRALFAIARGLFKCLFNEKL
ncbi:acetylserotonin methytransferase-like protein [Ophiostoma piceae UAMH 11346]|uniref:Acetylserotonin methytransferase-like protein n=1 Tax=Ophiostoma piceae (strain UAMH 11346) TaxID=1262450 RepID=S3C776_OPHP1|nr:acetylserotonin methytransferase-like protein [Ophiostoma piceae UAMH 11346]